MQFFEKAFKGFYRGYNNTLESLVGKIFPSWITPNGITIFRAFMFVPVVLLLLLGYQITAFILFVIAGYMDSLDGLLARSRNQLTAFGAALDAMMDKVFFVCLVTLIVFLMDYSQANFSFTIVFIFITILIVLIEIVLTIVRWQDYLRFAANKNLKLAIAAKSSGKIKFLLEMCASGAFVLGYPESQGFFSILGAGFILLALPFAFRSLSEKISARS